MYCPDVLNIPGSTEDIPFPSRRVFQYLQLRHALQVQSKYTKLDVQPLPLKDSLVMSHDKKGPHLIHI